MASIKKTAVLEFDEALEASIDRRLSSGDFTSFDELASVALAEFLDEIDDARLEAIRQELARRASEPLSDALRGDDADKALDAEFAKRGLI